MQPLTPYRIASIDILRGIVMVIMALDHTREFFHKAAMIADPLDPGTTTAVVYFTRWITHFCAPVFVLLSGTSAYLSGQRKSGAQASFFLIKRGIWLIIVEVAVISLALSFNPFYNAIFLQVIWAIGCSMILLGLLSRISFTLVFIVGVILFAGHNATDYITTPASGTKAAYVWSLFLTARGTVIPISADHFVFDLYAILPWTGIMLLGYCLGAWFRKEIPPKKRKQWLLLMGSGLSVLFIILRLLKGYGDLGAFSSGKNVLLSFLNTSKYPPSLQYASMTLGPSLIVLALLEDVQSAWTKIVSVYGKVPLFYYVLHFYLLHSLLVVMFFLGGYDIKQIADPESPFLFRPVNFGFSLVVVYIIWLSLVAALYFPCRWFSKYKNQHSQWWLRYL